METSNCWQMFRSEKEKFQVLLPGMVIRDFHSILGRDDGISPATIVYTASEINIYTYQIRVSRMMMVFGSSYDFLQTAFNEMCKLIPNCQVISSVQSEFRSYSSIDFKLRLTNSIEMIGNEVLAGKVLYIISTIGPLGSLVNHKKLLDSFEILSVVE